jgi:hypothetical protein
MKNFFSILFIITCLNSYANDIDNILDILMTKYGYVMMYTGITDAYNYIPQKEYNWFVKDRSSIFSGNLIKSEALIITAKKGTVVLYFTEFDTKFDEGKTYNVKENYSDLINDFNRNLEWLIGTEITIKDLFEENYNGFNENDFISEMRNKFGIIEIEKEQNKIKIENIVCIEGDFSLIAEVSNNIVKNILYFTVLNDDVNARLELYENIESIISNKYGEPYLSIISTAKNGLNELMAEKIYIDKNIYKDFIRTEEKYLLDNKLYRSRWDRDTKIVALLQLTYNMGIYTISIMYYY